MRTQPLVSVVIPTRDRNVDVQRAIASALRQTLSDIEIIVVDDGSARPTRDAVGSVVTDPRVRFHRNDSPTGPSSARNTGTAQARGDFVAYLDSDDEWHPSKLERQVRALRCGGGGAGLSLCGYELCNGDLRKVRVPQGVRAGNTVELLDTRHEPTVTSCFVLPITIARTFSFDATLSAYEDLDLAARISTGLDIVTTRMILVRKHVSTQRQFSGARIIDARRALLAKYADILGRHPDVVARNELVIAAELARAGRTDDARALLTSIGREHVSPWLRLAKRTPSTTPKSFARLLESVRLLERFSPSGALWRVRNSRLRWHG
jgi:glycosyltransferase involved in cell wall biosynthesis